MSDDHVEGIVRRVPDTVMTHLTRTFTCELLRTTREQILARKGDLP